MKLYVITAKPSADDAAWVCSAWDEWTIEENPEGFEEDVKKQMEKHKDSLVKIGIVEVPDNFFEKIYSTPKVKGELVEVREANGRTEQS